MADKVIDAQSKAALEKLRSGLHQHKKFVVDNKAALFRLADGRTEFEFLRRALRWLDTQTVNQSPDDEKG